MWNGTMFVDLDRPLNASSLFSASAELLVHLRELSAETKMHLISIFFSSVNQTIRVIGVIHR